VMTTLGDAAARRHRFAYVLGAAGHDHQYHAPLSGHADLATNRGVITLCFDPALAPVTVNNFVLLARNQFLQRRPRVALPGVQSLGRSLASDRSAICFLHS